MKEAVLLQMIGTADEAMEILVDLMNNATSEAVRLSAVNSLFDRAGIRGGAELDIKVSAGESPADVLRERLAKLQERSRLGQEAQSRVIDGEVVLEDDTVTTEAKPLEETP